MVTLAGFVFVAGLFLSWVFVLGSSPFSYASDLFDASARVHLEWRGGQLGFVLVARGSVAAAGETLVCEPVLDAAPLAGLCQHPGASGRAAVCPAAAAAAAAASPWVRRWLRTDDPLSSRLAMWPAYDRRELQLDERELYDLEHDPRWAFPAPAGLGLRSAVMLRQSMLCVNGGDAAVLPLVGLATTAGPANVAVTPAVSGEVCLVSTRRLEAGEELFVEAMNPDGSEAPQPLCPGESPAAYLVRHGRLGPDVRFALAAVPLGFDTRMFAAAGDPDERGASGGGGAGGGWVTVRGERALVSRLASLVGEERARGAACGLVRARLLAFPTSLAADDALLANFHLPPRRQAAVLYRRAWKRSLHALGDVLCGKPGNPAHERVGPIQGAGVAAPEDEL